RRCRQPDRSLGEYAPRRRALAHARRPRSIATQRPAHATPGRAPAYWRALAVGVCGIGLPLADRRGLFLVGAATRPDCVGVLASLEPVTATLQCSNILGITKMASTGQAALGENV